MHAPGAAALARRLRFAHDATRQPVVQLLRRLQHGLALRVRVHVVAHPDPRRGRAARDLAPELLGHVHLVARPELQTRRNGARGERMRTCAQTCGVRRSQRRHCCGTDHEAKRGCLARGPAQAHQHKQSEWRSRPHPRVRPQGVVTPSQPSKQPSNTSLHINMEQTTHHVPIQNSHPDSLSCAPCHHTLPHTAPPVNPHRPTLRQLLV